jgi:hypothetical protein
VVQGLTIVRPDCTHVLDLVAVLQVSTAPLRVTTAMPQEGGVTLIAHTHPAAGSVALARVEVVLVLDMSCAGTMTMTVTTMAAVDSPVDGVALLAVVVATCTGRYFPLPTRKNT